MGLFVSCFTANKKCFCGEPAERELEEVIHPDDPVLARAPVIAYICFKHFAQIAGVPADKLAQREENKAEELCLST